jgi:hypothetical protein
MNSPNVTKGIEKLASRFAGEWASFLFQAWVFALSGSDYAAMCRHSRLTMLVYGGNGRLGDKDGS